MMQWMKEIKEGRRNGTGHTENISNDETILPNVPKKRQNAKLSVNIVGGKDLKELGTHC